jgi:hypothetical protein
MRKPNILFAGGVAIACLSPARREIMHQSTIQDRCEATDSEMDGRRCALPKHGPEVPHRHEEDT